MLAEWLRPVLSLPASWDQFWFRAERPQRLGNTRMAIGAVALIQFLVYCVWVPDWLSGHGWFDTETGRFFIGEGLPDTGSEFRWSLLFRWPSPMVARSICILGAIASAATMAGIGSRLAPLLAWGCMMTIHHRAPWLTLPAEFLLSAGLLYLVIDTGRIGWSWRPARFDSEGLPRTSVRLATRCIQVHFLIWLACCFASMLQQDVWWNGSAISILSGQGHGLLGPIDRESWLGQAMTLAMLLLPAAAIACWSRIATYPFGFLAILAFASAVVLFAGDGLYALAMLAMSVSLLPLIGSEERSHPV